MKTIYLLGYLLLGSNLIASAQSTDELWEQAERIVLESKVWIPGSVETEQIVKNGKGKVESENKIKLEILRDPETGNPQGHLEQMLENDRDHTEKVRKELEADLQKEILGGKRDFPFHLENPSDAVTGKSPNLKTVDGVECVGYEFEVNETDEDSNEPFRFEGTVWIDPATAVPMEIESHLMDLPKKADGAEIVSMVFSRKYGLQEGAWITRSEHQEIWVNAKFLFKKIVVFVDTQTSYRNHWFWKEQL